MNIKLKLILLLTIISYSIGFGQIGGKYAFEFLGNPQNARLTALGGSLITIQDEDINLAGSNPALLNDKQHNQLSFSHNFSFADISNGYISYGRKIEKWGGINTHLSVNYVNYGKFFGADEIGNLEGEFSGGETAVVLGAGKKLNEKISVGVNLKAIFGNLETYSSVGVGADVGIHYDIPASNMSLGMVVKNIGTQLSAYGIESYNLPLDIQIGISKKLNHLPFRFSIIAHQLQQWNVRYDDPNNVETESILGEPVSPQSDLSKGVDNFFRHFIFNGEFLLGKTQGFKLRFGYNHHRRKELSLANFRSLAGFNLGLGIRIKKINIDYGLGYYHLAGSSNHISIRTDLGRFFKKF